MSEARPSFQSRILQRSVNTDDFKLYRAGLEWDLLDPIVIESKEDMKSESKWRDLVEPFHHQVTNLITFCRRLPVTLLSDDVGLGKTISAGLIASELIARHRVSKILIVCPKLLMPQWAEELRCKFDIKSQEAIGSELEELNLPDEPIAVITTYHSARLHLDAIGKAGFDMLILDEAHKLRNLYGVNKTPQVATAFHKVLSDRVFRYVLMLTATPIQNRLWDLYSLVDLLTAARGHENPLGNTGMFARKFIADSRSEARHLKQEAKDEFRSIIYGYMSRVRRGDANLVFPERIVQSHTVEPTTGELELIKVIAEPIQKLNILAQIVILQALISSPEALVRVLTNMLRKGTIDDEEFVENAKSAAKKIKMTSKLKGLEELIGKLRAEQPEHWRVVIFTKWLETQTTIQAFLEEKGIKCGLINGESGPRNQETIASLKTIPPTINVIISTEAGSEGVNLQAANVLVNYDLPWNPMIVEQRIGRIQRLASKHANVCIFNIVLKGTFEEYIVARLMEKLQMASHAIGDIEALLEASGLGGDNEEENGFERKIAKLVLASLKGKNVEEETRKAAESIAEAKVVLEREEKNINDMLGGMEEDNGPKCPKLPTNAKSMDLRSFTIAGLEKLGATITPQSKGFFISDIDGKRDLVTFEKQEDATVKSTLYAEGSPEFERLVDRITSSGLHHVRDTDDKPEKEAESIAKEWTSTFGGVFKKGQLHEVWNCYSGTALVRVRATVAHDSYERLVEIGCSPEIHTNRSSKKEIEDIGDIIKEPAKIGISDLDLIEKAMQDPGISEFCRFYNERKVHEVRSAGSDERRKKKLEDEFTPRLEIALVGLEGSVFRKIKLKASYKIQDNEYLSTVFVRPSGGEIIESPELERCEQTNQIAPGECLAKCAITRKKVLKHLLVKSEISERWSLPEHTVVCAITNKRVMEDETEKSSVSGKIGCKSEFVYCAETGKPLLANEAEKCEVTGKYVMPGKLEKCEVTGKNVLPTELEKSAASGKKALKKFFVSSSISNARILEEEAVRSIGGNFCAPLEAKLCLWSVQKCHPDDLVTCELTGIPLHIEFATTEKPESLASLVSLLNQIIRKEDGQEYWSSIEEKASKILRTKNCKIDAAEFSPNKKQLAVSLEVKTLLGFKVRYAGLVYSAKDKSILGRISIGKRDARGWQSEKN